MIFQGFSRIGLDWRGLVEPRSLNIKKIRGVFFTLFFLLTLFVFSKKLGLFENRFFEIFGFFDHF